MTIPPTQAPSRFGLLGGDVAGFPNGRRLADDVVDIAERVVAGATPFTPAFNVAPNNQLGDGIDFNDMPFMADFPYVAPPHNPFAHTHHPTQNGTSARSLFTRSDEPSTSALNLSIKSANPGTISRLAFDVPSRGHVTLKVYDLQGREVRTLVDQDAAPGTFAAQWDGRSDEGVAMGKGVYFVRLVQGTQVTQKKGVLQ